METLPAQSPPQQPPLALPPALSLVDRLQQCAGLWTESHPEPKPSLARLGKLAAGDNAFFDRVGAVRGPTTSMLERFARFFAEPANWPGGAVPQEARDFAHVTGVSAGCAACGERACGHSDLEYQGVVPALHGDGANKSYAARATGKTGEMSGGAEPA